MSRMAEDIPRSINATVASDTATHAARVALVCGFALLTCLGARISVPIPMSPVPGTLQTLAVLLAGAFLGSRAGMASQATYITMGLVGLPVFALGGGPGYLLGPTGGYLAGFLAAPWVVGKLLGGRRRFGPAWSFLALLAGALTIEICGFAWLSVVLGDPLAAFRAGVAPFALFDLAKVILATGIHAGYDRWNPLKRN